jgi:outer membrane autotransporter protein
VLGKNTYTGDTVVTAGILKLGDGVTAGSSIANSNSVLVANQGVLALDLRSGETFGNSVTDNGQIRWIAPGSNTQSASSIFSGTGSMQVTSPGTTVLLGTNTFIGGTTINTTGMVLAGNLSGNTSSAFGSGVFTLNNGFVDTYNSRSLKINVGGYQQTGGEIDMHVAGTTPGTYTQYNVSGSANLSGGTVYVYDLSGNYVPQGGWAGNPNGDTQNIIHTTTGRTGQFASNAPYSRIYNSAFDTEFFYHQGDTLLYPTVTYDNTNAYITWVQEPFESPPNLTHNQNSVGELIDGYQNQNPSTSGGIVTYLDGQNKADLAAMYDLIAPDELTAIFQIGFSNAEIQNANIERHLDMVRQNSVAITAVDIVSSSKSGLGSKGGMVEQTSVSTSPEGKMWSFFVEGTGGSATVDGDQNANGYDFDTSGITVGADRRINDHLVIGVLGSYANSEASLVNNGSIDIESYRGAVYATAYSNGFYVDALLGAGKNDYETKRSSMFDYANGSLDGWELNALINTGYDFHAGQWTLSPMASLAYTQVNINSFTETDSLTPLSFPDQHQDSLRSNLGARIAYTAIVGGMTITPQVRLSWQHEFLDSTQSIDSQFASGSSPMFTVDGPGMDRDRALISAGVSVQITPCLCIYGFYDGQLGSSNYSSNTVSAGLKFDF